MSNFGFHMTNPYLRNYLTQIIYLAIMRMIIEVSGRVQGVGYRYSACKAAERYGVIGYVKNLPSGNVRLEIEGTPEAVQAMISWCREGPPMARVNDLRVWESAEKASEDSFRMRF